MSRGLLDIRDLSGNREQETAFLDRRRLDELRHFLMASQTRCMELERIHPENKDELIQEQALALAIAREIYLLERRMAANGFGLL
ncbi:MAG: hypothetical protein ABIK68_05685 [bacterium]